MELHKISKKKANALLTFFLAWQGLSNWGRFGG
jgi:hypothetical protein